MNMKSDENVWLTCAASLTDKYRLHWYTISSEQMCQLVDSYIILRAFDRHHLKVFERKRSPLRFDTGFHWLPDVWVLFAEQHDCYYTRAHILKTQVNNMKKICEYVTYCHTSLSSRKSVSKLGECCRKDTNALKSAPTHHSPRDKVFRLLKNGQLFSSLIRITFRA
jgi:hypothetical protein